MLIGEYHHSLDDKNRLMIPSKLLPDLGQEVILTRGFDQCIIVYPINKWDELIAKFSEIPITKSESRKFMRIFLSSATSCKFDNQKRICLPGILKSYANIIKEVVILGIDDHLEIWSEDSYKKFLDENLNEFALIAENIM